MKSEICIKCWTYSNIPHRHLMQNLFFLFCLFISSQTENALRFFMMKIKNHMQNEENLKEKNPEIYDVNIAFIEVLAFFCKKYIFSSWNIRWISSCALKCIHYLKNFFFSFTSHIQLALDILNPFEKCIRSKAFPLYCCEMCSNISNFKS